MKGASLLYSLYAAAHKAESRGGALSAEFANRPRIGRPLVASCANPGIGDFSPIRKADDDMECGLADVDATVPGDASHGHAHVARPLLSLHRQSGGRWDRVRPG